jgi:endonuclease/exonuclease/phosphatase (EEP) superfamily protein YafD
VEVSRDLRGAIAKRASLAASLLWIPTFAGFAGGAWWVFDLASHFRVQWAAAALICLVLTLLRPGRSTAIPAVPCAVNLACILPLLFAPERAASSSSPLSVVSFNVHTANEEKDEVVAFLRRADADVILLYEVDSAWLAAMKRLPPEYRPIVEIPSQDNFGIAAIARVPVASHRVLDLSPYGVPTIELTIPWEGRELLLLGTHTLPPMSGHYARARDAQLANIAAWSSMETRPHAVLGDLNVTPWSAHLSALLERGRLQRFGGTAPTWPYSSPLLWPFRIPIDHVLISPELAVVAWETGRACGSDHLPLQVSLGFAIDN